MPNYLLFFDNIVVDRKSDSSRKKRQIYTHSLTLEDRKKFVSCWYNSHKWGMDELGYNLCVGGIRQLKHNKRTLLHQGTEGTGPLSVCRSFDPNGSVQTRRTFSLGSLSNGSRNFYFIDIIFHLLLNHFILKIL